MAPKQDRKPSKPLKPPRPDPPDADSRLLDRALSTLERGIVAVDGAIKAASDALKASLALGEYGKEAREASSHVAWLTNQFAQTTREVRQIEAHDQSQLKKLTLSTVLEWYRQLSDDERADLQRRIDSIRKGTSILSL
jgi:hypothetical protein